MFKGGWKIAVQFERRPQGRLNGSNKPTLKRQFYMPRRHISSRNVRLAIEISNGNIRIMSPFNQLLPWDIDLPPWDSFPFEPGVFADCWNCKKSLKMFPSICSQWIPKRWIRLELLFVLLGKHFPSFSWEGFS